MLSVYDERCECVGLQPSYNTITAAYNTIIMFVVYN